jgi:prepilin-type N-terminal cleavage/methylation domain-containing protein
MTSLSINQHGTTLIESLVALLLFALVASATAQALARSQRSRISSGNWMEAAELAGELMEQLRAGENVPESQDLGIFTRSWARGQFAASPGLDRIDVDVRWHDGDDHAVALSGLARSRP